MKNIKIILITYLLLLSLSSCSNKENQISETSTSTSIIDNNISSLIKSSGINSLKQNKNNTWKEFHKNYLKTIEEYKYNDNLNSYKSSLITHQILNTKLINEINSENFTIILLYLEDLKNLKTAYPQVNYLALKSIEPFVERNILASFAKVSYEKGVQQKQRDKERMNKLLESFDDVEIKNTIEDNYNSNFNEYLPKLKEFLFSEN